MVTCARPRSAATLLLTAALLAGAGCNPGGRSDPDDVPPAVAVADAFALDPLGAERLSVYGAFSNLGGTVDTLRAIRSPIGEIGSLHAMVTEQGLMTMREMDGIELPIGEAVRLEPGSLHGMIAGLRRTPATGDTVEVTFEFARAPAQTLRIPVRHPADARPVPPGA